MGTSRHRALVLFSGGLDSSLAALVLRRQGIDVVGVTFTSPFFESAKADAMAKALDIPLRIVDISAKTLAVVRKPRHGYGKHMNPCIDCHALMLREAAALLDELGADFIATGEVLGERPKSQNRRALSVVAEESGVPDIILRPLSARLLPETLPERAGWVDRDRLLDIEGRSRRRQFELAEDFGLTDVPTPAGGCRLTDPGYAARLRTLLDHMPDPSLDVVRLIRYGRHIWLRDTLILVSRDEAETVALESMDLAAYPVLALADEKGPVTVVVGEPTEDVLRRAAELTVRYSKARSQPTAAVLYEHAATDRRGAITVVHEAPNEKR